MDNLDHAPSTLSLSSSDTGIFCEDLNNDLFSVSLKVGNPIEPNNRLLAPSFEAIKNAFGKLYDINDFELEKIASGFFGDVYKAHYKPSGETMVVKCNKKNQGKMLREVELMRKLGDHPNIIKFRGGCVDGARVYSLTEYMNGGTLEQLLIAVDEPISWNQREKLCHDIACGMQYLHTKKYMHRDLTTKNVLIRTDITVSKASEQRFHAVVADFGLATEIRDSGSMLSAGNSYSSNKPLAVVGSAWWMAPECIELAIKAKFTRTNERGYNERVDVFSFGIIVCQICARIEADPEYLQRTANYGVDYMALSKLVEDDPIARHLMLLAMDCTKYLADDRPSFAQIADRLHRSRTYGPGLHLVDKRLRNRHVWRPASTALGPYSSGPRADGPTRHSFSSQAAGNGPDAAPAVASPVLSSPSQLPQVWVHTVIRTIDPDFRPARSNPFAALEDHFRDGRKTYGMASSGSESNDVDNGSAFLSISPSVNSPSPRLPAILYERPGLYEYRLSNVSFKLVGSLSEGFGDSASSVSMSLPPGDQLIGATKFGPSIQAVKSPSSTASSIGEGRKCTSTSASQEANLASGRHQGRKSSTCRSIITVVDSAPSPDISSSSVRSLPCSPCPSRRAKSVYVGNSTAIRFFTPVQQTPANFDVEDPTNVQSVVQPYDSVFSRALTHKGGGSVNRVVWSRVRFFETLSQEQQQRWQQMIANNKIAEEQRKAAALVNESS